jgi:hypothetical protein
MSEAICAKCNKAMARVPRWFKCEKCGSWFCPSCMDRFCLFDKGAVKETPKPA